MPNGIVNNYIEYDRKTYNAIKQASYRRLSKCSYTIGVVCSGGGGVESGAIMAGFRPAWGIDVNPTNEVKFKLSQMCSDFNELNHGSHVIRQSLLDIDIENLSEVDIILGSLPCDRASALSNLHGHKESELDTLLAQKFISILIKLNPKAIFVENVQNWVHFEGSKLILKYLEKSGYIFDYGNYNFADYGIPQRRRRLIIRACKEGTLKAISQSNPVSWYDAIYNLIPLFEEGKAN